MDKRRLQDHARLIQRATEALLKGDDEVRRFLVQMDRKPHCCEPIARIRQCLAIVYKATRELLVEIEEVEKVQPSGSGEGGEREAGPDTFV